MINDRSLLDALNISLITAVSSALISIAIGTLGALSINNFNFKLNKKLAVYINTVTYIPIIIPEIILAVSLLIFFSFLNLSYGILTLILAHTTFCIPYIFIMVSLRLSLIDPFIYEAAADLGAKRSQVFMTITLPVIFPSIISGALLAVAMSLDDVIISVFLSGVKSTTLPVKIFSLLKLGANPKINAMFTVILLFTFIIAILSQLIDSLQKH